MTELDKFLNFDINKIYDFEFTFLHLFSIGINPLTKFNINNLDEEYKKYLSFIGCLKYIHPTCFETFKYLFTQWDIITKRVLVNERYDLIRLNLDSPWDWFTILSYETTKLSSIKSLSLDWETLLCSKLNMDEDEFLSYVIDWKLDGDFDKELWDRIKEMYDSPPIFSINWLINIHKLGESHLVPYDYLSTYSLEDIKNNPQLPWTPSNIPPEPIINWTVTDIFNNIKEAPWKDCVKFLLTDSHFKEVILATGDDTIVLCHNTNPLEILLDIYHNDYQYDVVKMAAKLLQEHPQLSTFNFTLLLRMSNKYPLLLDDLNYLTFFSTLNSHKINTNKNEVLISKYLTRWIDEYKAAKKEQRFNMSFCLDLICLGGRDSRDGKVDPLRHVNYLKDN